MTPEQFEAIFESIKNTNGVGSALRNLVLKLAVSGQLTSQNEHDLASSYFEEIRSQRSQLINSRKIKKNNKLTDEQAVEIFEIPANWKWVKLGEISEYIQRGKSPKYTEQTLFPVISQKCVQWSGLDLTKAKYVDPDSLVKYEPERFLKNGDLLWNSTGTGTIGRLVQLTNVPDKLICDSHVTVVRSPWVETKYLLYFLKSPHVYGEIENDATGSTNQIELTAKLAVNQSIPLPPLEEQKRIVAKVDELMALCDDLEDARDTELKLKSQFTSSTNSKLVSGGQIQNEVLNYSTQLQLSTKTQIEKYKQTMLELAMRGKLCKQLADDEPAHVTLKKIAHDMGKTISDEISPADKPFDLPDGWSWAHFSSLGEFGRGKSKHRPRNDPTLYSNGTYPFVQTGDVARSEGKITTFSDKYNDKGLDQSRLWPEGTLCITIAANIADTGILSFDACFPDSVVGFIPNELFDNARFFEYFLRTAKANLAEYAPATAQKNINLKILNAVLIPIPPLKEMNRIVEKLDGIMAACERLEASLGIEDNTKSDLLKTLVA